MAQARDKRRQRAKQRRSPTTSPSPLAEQRTTRLRRLVIAFLVILAVAGILAVAAPNDGTGAPSTPGTTSRAAR